MNIFTFLTPVIYWLLIVIWFFILFFYVKRLKSGKVKGQLLNVLLVILAIDAFRTLFESVYFGAWYTSLAGFLPKYVFQFLVRPELVFIPKILNAIAAVAVIVILIYQWLPKEEKEKQDMERLVNQRTNALTQRNMQLSREIAERARIEKELKNKTHEIGERVKELKCLYAVSNLLEETEVDISDTFQSIVNLMPVAWQYPHVTCARIIVGGNEYRTNNFELTVWQQMSDVIIFGESKGRVEAYCLEERIEADEGPFLKEERDLINEIADRIGLFFERKETEEKSKKLEIELLQIRKMESIGTLAGGIAHDFNNILFPIIGHTEMLLEDTPSDSPLRESLDQVFLGALRARDLVKQILTFSRQGDMELISMDIKPVLGEAFKLLRASIPATIEMQIDINPDCGHVKAEATQIHQVVMNLVTNAFHSMADDGGELTVSLKDVELGKYDIVSTDMAPGRYICLTVADTGHGMDKEISDKIFDPFFTTKGPGEGTGMGLSVVYGIVKNMGGVIQLYSEPDTGSEFHVYLPVIQDEIVIKTQSVLDSVATGSERVLLVDDENAIITMEKKMLERLGYQVTPSTSSLEALEIFSKDPGAFDLVISDMSMPKMSGDRLAEEINKIRADVPVLLCSGLSANRKDKEKMALGVKGFIIKPIIMKELSGKIREILDNQNDTINL